MIKWPQGHCFELYYIEYSQAREFYYSSCSKTQWDYPRPWYNITSQTAV